jgi:DNA-binding XRE family transcriptional regulator
MTIFVVLVPRLRRVRDQRALTQEELAWRAGVSRTTVMRAERGEDIRQSSVRKLARALGVSPATLQRVD